MTNKTLNHNNKVNELFDISEIYKRIYSKVTKEPDLLISEVIIRHKTKSDHLNALSAPSGFTIVSKYYKEDSNFRSVFNFNKDDSIEVFTQHNGSLLFIVVNNIKLTLVDSNNSKQCRTINFKKEVTNLQIILDNEYVDSDVFVCNVDGSVYFSDSINLYCGSLQGKSFELKHEFNTEIKDILILGSNHLLLVFSSSIVLFNIIENRIQDEYQQNEQIQNIKSTVPDKTVFSVHYLDCVETITIILFFKSLIKIYNFNGETGSLYLLATIGSFEGIQWSQFSCVDDSFMIDSRFRNSSNNCAVRLVVLADLNKQIDFLIMMEVNNDGFYKISPKMPFQRSLDIPDRKIIGFKSNILVMGSEKPHTCLSVYDLESCELKSNSNQSFFKRQFSLSWNQYGDAIIEEINDDNDLKELYKTNCSLFTTYTIQELIQVKDSKMLVKFDGLNTIQEVECLSNPSDSIKGNKIKLFQSNNNCALDRKHILVETENKLELFEMSIVDVTQQRIVSSLVVNEHYWNVKVLCCNKDYLVLFYNETRCLDIYKIDKGLLQFKKMLTQYVDTAYDLKKCHIDDLSTHTLMMALYNKSVDSIDVRTYETYGKNKLRHKNMFFRILEGVKLNKNDMNVLITSLNCHLILFGDKLLYFIDIHKNNGMNQIEFDHDIGESNVKCVPDTDDLIVDCHKSIYYVKVDSLATVSKIRLKKYRNSIREVVLQNGCLTVIRNGINPKDVKVVQLYKLSHLNGSDKKPNISLKFSKDINEVMTYTDGKYVIIQACAYAYFKIFVYHIHNKSKLVSYLKLKRDTHYSLHLISINEQYVNFGADDTLLTMKINI